VAVAARALAPPLCVDLDGTLLHCDLLQEQLLAFLRRNPLHLFLCLAWLLKGKALLKARLAARVTFDPTTVPFNGQLLAWLRHECAAGREIWLCTAANERLARSVAEHLGVFAGVTASDERTNLAGEAKAAALVQRFGEKGFDYCGNERRDLAIWQRARGAIVVNGTQSLERRAASGCHVLRTFSTVSVGQRLQLVWRALRPHQWTKNVLLLIPLLAAHRLANVAALTATALGIVSFCLAASSVYLLNDMLDLEADRGHPRKAQRPFASGALPLAVGFALCPALLLAGALLAALLPADFQYSLTAYCGLTLLYSLALKRFLLIDAVALAGLYTLRIIAGAGAAGVALSFWLLLFSVFLFLSLAFVKRYAELDALRRQQQLRALGRGYRVEDLAMLQSFGTAAGYLSVLVLALYINSPDIEALYRHPKVIWMLCILMLYWISRVWMTTHRGAMHDDPVVYALRDKVSIGVGIVGALTIAAAI
jgi:4-hydroxybenzoate polyprenyltransferase/phosphoserine phosphatase